VSRGRRFGVCLYVGTDVALEPQPKFLDAAIAQGCALVMTSLHLPEMDMARAPVECRAIAARTRPAGVTFIADVSPLTFRHLGGSPANTKALADLGLDGIRPDYGFDAGELAAMARGPGPAVVLNATDATDERLEAVAAAAPHGLAGAWAIHNFYPRPETGIALETCVERSLRLVRLGVRIGAFVASQHVRRGPVHEGLPTIEDFRRLPPARAAEMLFATGAIDAALLGDPSLDDAEVKALAGVAGRDEIVIRARRHGEPSREELAVMDGPLTCWAVAQYLLRTGNPALRPAAAAGPRETIAPRNTEARPAYSITIDNERYPRFAGTLHIVRSDLPADPRVNVVGSVHPEDRVLIDLLRSNDRFRFVWSS